MEPVPIPTSTDVALLAPVPLEHLLDGQETAEKEGRVAFGSRSWELFRELDHLCEGMPIDVYIYASHAKEPYEYEISWQARYVRHVPSNNGAHPDGMRYRPASTDKYSGDNTGYWAIFWEVEDLHELPQDQHIFIGKLIGYGKKKAYGYAFPPEGPILIKHP